MKPTIERFDQLGDMPDDELLMNRFAHRALGVALLMVTRAKKKLTKWELQQIKLVESISARMTPLTPISRIAAAEDVVLGRKGSDRGPQTEKSSASEEPASDSTYRGPPARRGRPRRRAVR